MSIKQAIDRYVSAGLKRWHTPGHKGLLNERDITEIGEDSDKFPSDEIELAQHRAAAFYNSRHCRFLVCGSSMGVKAAILSAGGNILAAKGRHRCVREGAELAKAEVFDIDCDFVDGLYLPPTPQQVEKGLKVHPDVAAVLIVSPDYYGRTASLQIKEIASAAGKVLIADSAHGAHFAARRDLFENDFSDTADFCIMSAHKTLNAYTQSAYMCVNNDSFIQRVDRNLRLLGTTSPSYLLMEGLDGAIEHCAANAKKYDELLSALTAFRREVKCLPNSDFTRVVVDAAQYTLTGRQLYDRLYAAGHSAEMFDERRTVFIVTLADSAGDIQRLKTEVLRAVNER